jgi:hypothetical protein
MIDCAKKCFDWVQSSHQKYAELSSHSLITRRHTKSDHDLGFCSLNQLRYVWFVELYLEAMISVSEQMDMRSQLIETLTKMPVHFDLYQLTLPLSKIEAIITILEGHTSHRRPTRSNKYTKTTLMKKKPMEKLFMKFPESQVIMSALIDIYTKKLALKIENVSKIVKTYLVHILFSPIDKVHSFPPKIQSVTMTRFFKTIESLMEFCGKHF